MSLPSSREGEVSHERRRARRSMRWAGVGVVVALAVASCSRSDEPDSQGPQDDRADNDVALVCEELAGQPWRAVPSDAGIDRIADVLDAPPEDVAGGLLITAACDQSLTIDEVNELPVASLDILPGVACAVRYIVSPERPTEGKHYDSFGLICPAVLLTTS
jgi:hypothetical protein